MHAFHQRIKNNTKDHLRSHSSSSFSYLDFLLFIIKKSHLSTYIFFQMLCNIHYQYIFLKILRKSSFYLLFLVKIFFLLFKWSKERCTSSCSFSCEWLNISSWKLTPSTTVNSLSFGKICTFKNLYQLLVSYSINHFEK